MTGELQQSNKQTNILRDTETDKHLGRKHTKGRKILTNRRTSRLMWTQRERERERAGERETERHINKK